MLEMTTDVVKTVFKETIRVKLCSGEIVRVGLMQFVKEDPALWVYRLDGTPYVIDHFNSGGYQRRISRNMVSSTINDDQG